MVRAAVSGDQGPGSQGPALDSLAEMLRASKLFCILFTWRYLRQVVHLISFWLLYRPAPRVVYPRYTRKDVTVIMPTIDPHNPEFIACIESCWRNHPAHIIIVTAGDKLLDGTQLDVIATNIANKRVQVAAGIALVTTDIIVLLDDHVVWGPRFLASALLPFHNERVGAVATNKRVQRERHTPTLTRRFWNVIQCLYLERHNFEIRSTNAVDGGVFVISGRTSLVRTTILQDPKFLIDYTNEHFFFGCFGPLAADDDNYLTRYLVRAGWKIAVQYTQDSMITTTLGSYAKFSGGLQRWARTTWRSNSASLRIWRVWVHQPWCVYAVYFTSFTNLALLYDPILIGAYIKSSLYARFGGTGVVVLIAWMLFFKMVKPFAYFWRYPQDIIWLPAYFLFTWYHSIVKLQALFTFWDCKWSGRNLNAIAVRREGANDGENGDNAAANQGGGEIQIPGQAHYRDSVEMAQRATTTA